MKAKTKNWTPKFIALAVICLVVGICIGLLGYHYLFKPQSAVYEALSQGNTSTNWQSTKVESTKEMVEEIVLLGNGKKEPIDPKSEEGTEIASLLTCKLHELNLQATCVFSEEGVQYIKRNHKVMEIVFKEPIDITISQWVEPEEGYHIPVDEKGYRILEKVKTAIFLLEDVKGGGGLEAHILVGSERKDRDERCSWKVTEKDREKYKELGPIWSMIAGYEFDEERGCVPVGGSKYIKDVVPFKTKEECELACGRMWSCWAIEKGDEGLDKGWIEEINEIISTEENIKTAEQKLCEDTGGVWINNSCLCPPGLTFTSEGCVAHSQYGPYLGIHCCEECLEAFSGCPIAVGPEALMCGKFSSGYNMSEECKQYFKEHPASVTKCESLLKEQSETQNVIIGYNMGGLTKVHIENNKIDYTYSKLMEGETGGTFIGEYAQFEESAQISEEEIKSLLKIFEENDFFNLKEEYGNVSPYDRYYSHSIRLETNQKDKTVLFKDTPWTEEAPPEFINIERAILQLATEKFNRKG